MGSESDCSSRSRKPLHVIVTAVVLLLAGLGCVVSQTTPQPILTPTEEATPLRTPALTPVPALLPSPSATLVPTPPRPVEKGPTQLGQMERGTLLVLGTDVWRFEASAGQYVTIRMDAIDSGALDTYLELYDRGGELLAGDDDGGRDTNSAILEYPIVVSDTYAIHALAYSGAGDYVLSLEVADGPSGGGAIVYGIPVTGELLALWSRHPWTFEGEEGRVVTIAMNGTDGVLDCYLELYDPEGALLTDDDDSGEGLNALIETYTLPVAGAYRIIARGGEFGPTGTYMLTVARAEMVVQGTLAYSETVEAVLPSGTRHHWLFEGEEGDVVSISMVGVDEGMDAYLELFAPNGVRVATDDDSGPATDAAISEFELPVSGTYRIVARGHSDEDIGRYRLALVGP